MIVGGVRLHHGRRHAQLAQAVRDALAGHQPVHALELTAQRGVAMTSRLAAISRLVAVITCTAPEVKASKTAREQRGARVSGHALVDFGRDHLRAALRQLLLEEWTAADCP